MSGLKFSIDSLFGFLFKGKTSGGSQVHKMSAPRAELSVAKQAELELLCNKLFQKQELITSGRLQLLGLEKIKRRMGRRWEGMQGIIYDVCDSTMNKYMTKGDVFIRYKDDNYLLLFSTPSLLEIELKTTLIAEEIKRQLFEYEGFEELEILNQVSHIKPAKIPSNVLPFPESLNHAFERSLGEKPQDLMFSPVASQEPDLSQLRRTDVDAYADSGRKIGDLDLGVEKDFICYTHVQYMPVWDQHKKRLISYMCLGINLSAPEYDPLRGHLKLFERVSPARKAELDMAILTRVIDWLVNNPEGHGNFGIICPVHYDTLTRVESMERYKKMCQQIDGSMKQYILFMVMNVPQVPWVSLSQVISPLKTYGRVLCGEVPLHAPVDFESLRMSGFDHVGVILDPPGADNGQKKLLMDIRAFVVRAKKHLINKTFVLGIDDPATAGALAQMGVRFMAGGAVHECFREPKTHIDFFENPVFHSWQKGPLARGADGLKA